MIEDVNMEYKKARWYELIFNPFFKNRMKFNLALSRELIEGVQKYMKDQYLSLR